MTTTLVTGAGGYVGTSLVRLLAGSEMKTWAVDTFTECPDSEAFLASLPDTRVCARDVRTLTSDDLLGVDHVVHLAGLSNDASTAATPDLAASVNVDGAVKLAEASKRAGVRTFVFASSASVYGKTSGNIVTEASTTNPLSLYAQQKLEVERSLAGLADDSFRVVCLRKGTLFGSSYKMRHELVLNSMVAHAVDRNCVPIGGGGDQERPLLHVQDAALAYATTLRMAASLQPFSVLNVSAVNISIGALAARVSASLGVVCRIDDGPVDDRSYRMDSTKFETLTGFCPAKGVSDGIHELAQARRAIPQPEPA